MMSISFNENGNMDMVLADKKDRVVISCDGTGRPMEELMNFFLRCCQTKEVSWPDFSPGVKPGIECAYFSGNMDTTIICGNQLTVLQVDSGWRTSNNPQVTVLGGDWENYCAEFLRTCNENLLIDYCLRWAEYGDSDYMVARCARMAIDKLSEVEKAFRWHCKMIGIDYMSLS